MTYTPPPSVNSRRAHNKLATLLEFTHHGNAKDTTDNDALFRGAMVYSASAWPLKSHTALGAVLLVY
jgi:hypothetical protein